MTEIYILQSKRIDCVFGEHKDEWVIDGWTDDFRVAIAWKRSEHRDLRKQFESIKKFVPEDKK